MDKSKNKQEVVILPRGKDPIKKIVLRPKSSEAVDAMNEAFKTYVHPGVLLHGYKETEE